MVCLLILAEVWIWVVLALLTFREQFILLTEQQALESGSDTHAFLFSSVSIKALVQHISVALVLVNSQIKDLVRISRSTSSCTDLSYLVQSGPSLEYCIVIFNAVLTSINMFFMDMFARYRQLEFPFLKCRYAIVHKHFPMEVLESHVLFLLEPPLLLLIGADLAHDACRYQILDSKWQILLKVVVGGNELAEVVCQAHLELLNNNDHPLPFSLIPVHVNLELPHGVAKDGVVLYLLSDIFNVVHIGVDRVVLFG